jgi:hypothetical protein
MRRPPIVRKTHHVATREPSDLLVSRLVSRAHCPLCGSFLVAQLDPGAGETLGCPDPHCPVTDDPMDWLAFEE